MAGTVPYLGEPSPRPRVAGLTRCHGREPSAVGTDCSPPFACLRTWVLSGLGVRTRAVGVHGRWSFEQGGWVGGRVYFTLQKTPNCAAGVTPWGTFPGSG